MNFSELLFAEKEMLNIISHSAEQIKEDIIANPLKGCESFLKDADKGVPFSILRFSTIAENNWIISPEYYSQHVQAKMVYEYIKDSQTASLFINKINTLVNNEYIVIQKQKYPLNKNTLKVLRNFLTKCKV